MRAPPLKLRPRSPTFWRSELHRSEAWKANDLEDFVETAKGYLYAE